MALAYVVCKECSKLVKLGQERWVGKKVTCPSCYGNKAVVTSAALVEIAVAAPPTVKIGSEVDKNAPDIKRGKKAKQSTKGI